MFESLVFAGEQKVSARQFWALPMAALLQLSIGTTFVLISFFRPETLAPPPVWISALPAIPISLHAAPSRPVHRADDRTPLAAKPPGLVQPNTQDLPLASQVPSGPAEPAGPDDESGIPGLPEDFGIGTLGPAGTGTPLAPAKPLSVDGGDVLVPHLVRQVDPIYPPSALMMGLTGRVVLLVVVDENGRVTDVQVVSASSPFFTQAAVDAVRQWQYTRPVTRNGQVVACTMNVTVNFERR